MELSIIVPAYNEEKHITETLQRYAEHFPKICKKLEIIVVVNGSTDATLARTLELKKSCKYIRAINIPRKVGKGGAIITGLRAARYTTRGFLDADDAFELNDLNLLFEQLTKKRADVAIASKWKGQSFAKVAEPMLRKLLSRGWNTLAYLLLGLDFTDTQAGAKFFTKESWDSIQKDFIGKGFEFDIDLLSRFHNHGFRIHELYVRNRFRKETKFRTQHCIPMFINLLRIATRKKEQHPAQYYIAYKNWWQPTHIFYKNKMDRIISCIPEDATFLDAGCGSGVLSLIAHKKKNCKVTGVDIRKDQILFAKRLCPTGTFIQQDVQSMNLKKKFDVVNCSDVIEHFKDAEREKVLASLEKHVRPGGRLILAFPSWFYIRVFERFWKLARKAMSPFTHFDDDDIHIVVSQKKVIRFYAERGYSLHKQGTFGLGLLNYLVLKKKDK